MEEETPFNRQPNEPIEAYIDRINFITYQRHRNGNSLEAIRSRILLAEVLKALDRIERNQSLRNISK